MSTIYSTPTSLQRLDADGAFDEAQLAAAAFLARYSGRSLDADLSACPVELTRVTSTRSRRCRRFLSGPSRDGIRGGYTGSLPRSW